MAERDASVAPANDLQRRRIARRSKVESRLGRDIGMTPAIEHNPGDIAFGVESCTAQHLLQLPANLQLKICVTGAEQNSTGLAGLAIDRHARLRETHVEGQHGRFRRVERYRHAIDLHRLAHIHKESEAVKPMGGSYTQRGEGLPIVHRHVGNEDRSVMKPGVRSGIRRRQVAHDAAGDPATCCHNHSLCAHQGTNPRRRDWRRASQPPSSGIANGAGRKPSLATSRRVQRLRS